VRLTCGDGGGVKDVGKTLREICSRAFGVTQATARSLQAINMISRDDAQLIEEDRMFTSCEKTSGLAIPRANSLTEYPHPSNVTQLLLLAPFLIQPR